MVATAASPARQSLAQLIRYGGSPQVAVQLDDDGCGFCYYESSRVAVCVNKVNEYQRRFQFYEDNAAKTLLATIDEHAIGSAGRPKGKKLLLTKDGGILTDAADLITKSWRWDPKAQKAGSPPQEPVVIPLNESLVFTYKDRHAITVKFAPSPGISIVFECGERLRRSDTYLDHAHRATQGAQRGKLLIDQDVPTLQQRQKQIELTSIEKRSKAKPRSQDLGHGEIKALVATLETAFDAYEGCKVTPAADGNWKEEAKLQSLREIPMLAPTGTEVGDTPTLFGARVQANDATAAAQRLRNPETGQWLGSVELHERIREENPNLARKGALSVASGRYMRELPVAGYVNGRMPSQGAHLTLLPAAKLDAFLREPSVRGSLVVVACLRTDDPQSCAMELLLEQVQQRMNELASSPPASQTAAIAAKCRLVKCDLAESALLSDRFRIHATPTFLIFFETKLVHVSSLGGASRRVFPATTNAHLSNQVDALPRVLLVESVVKQQVAIEKVLRKEAFSWDLALGGDQAVVFLTRLPLRGGAPSGSVIDGAHNSTSVTLAGASSSPASYGLVLVSDTLGDADLRAIDRLVRAKDKSRFVLVCAVVSSPLTEVRFASGMCVDCRRAHGRRISAESTASSKTTETPLVCPHCGVIAPETKAALCSPVLAEVAHVFVYKHVKNATLHRLAEKWVARSRPASSSTPAKPSADESFTGLTVDSFFKEMERQYATAKRGVFMPEGQVPEMALSVVDAVLPATTASLGIQTTKRTPVNNVVNLVRSSSA